MPGSARLHASLRVGGMSGQRWTMATEVHDSANAGEKAGGGLLVTGLVLAVIGVGLMATVAATVPGLIVLVAGLALAGVSLIGKRAAAKG